MTKWISGVVALLCLMVSGPAYGQDKKAHRVVFEVTTEGTELWQSVLNNVENLQKALGKEATEVEVVAHGKGIGMLRKTNTELKDRIASLAGPKTKFSACQNTMRRLKLTKEDLLPEVGTVDSGVAQVVRQQEAGWSYIKSGS